MVSATIIPARKAPISAARPIPAAKAARPRQRSTAGSSGESAKRGAFSSCGRRRQQLGAAERDEGDEGDRDGQREGDLADVDAAFGGHPDRDREQDQGEDVVDHGGAEHGAGGAAAGDPEVEEDGRGDAGAGRRQGGAEEDRGLRAFADRQPEAEAARKGRTTPALPTASEVAPTSFISESRVSSPTQKSRKTTPSSEKTRSTSVTSTRPRTEGPIEDAAEDLADDRRLADPLEDLVAELGGEQDEEEVGEDRAGVGGCEGEREGAHPRPA